MANWHDGFRAEHPDKIADYTDEDIVEWLAKKESLTEAEVGDIIDNAGLGEDKKRRITEDALTIAGSALMSAAIMTGTENYITGDMVFPNGQKWTVEFKRTESK